LLATGVYNRRFETFNGRKMMKGFHNKVLHIDLSEKKFWSEDIPDTILSSLLGGRGLGA